MKGAIIVLAIVLAFSSFGRALANTYGAVDPIADRAVTDTGPLREQELDVRTAFAARLLECGIVEQVIHALSSTGAITTINDLNTRFEVGARGFAGRTNPFYVYTVVDRGPNAASIGDVKVLTDGLAYVLSQGSALLLDADNAGSFDFPTNYVVLNFGALPSIEQAAALFETVGRIDPDLFQTDTSGFTQYGRAYLSLQSFVPDHQFIAGYVQAAQESGLEYTPIVDGGASLFQGGAAFPGNDWVLNRAGEAYLARIPPQSHVMLGQIRDFHLRFTRNALRKIKGGDDEEGDFSGDSRRLGRAMTWLKCR